MCLDTMSDFPLGIRLDGVLPSHAIALQFIAELVIIIQCSSIRPH